MMDAGFNGIISPMNSSTNLSTSNSSDEKLRAENRDLKAEIESLKKQLDWLKRQIFGQKRERFIDTSCPVSLSLMTGRTYLRMTKAPGR